MHQVIQTIIRILEVTTGCLIAYALLIMLHNYSEKKDREER